MTDAGGHDRRTTAAIRRVALALLAAVVLATAGSACAPTLEQEAVSDAEEQARDDAASALRFVGESTESALDATPDELRSLLEEWSSGYLGVIHGLSVGQEGASSEVYFAPTGTGYGWFTASDTATVLLCVEYTARPEHASMREVRCPQDVVDAQEDAVHEVVPRDGRVRFIPPVRACRSGGDSSDCPGG